MSSRVWSIVIFAVVVAAIAGGAYYYKQGAAERAAAKAGGPGGRPGGGRPEGPGARIITVDVATAEKGTIRERLLLTGALKPKEQVDVTPKSTGRVEKIHVHVGDVVNAGDLIAELERDELEQQVRRAEAAIEVARAALAQRKAEMANAATMLARAEQLRQEGLISPQDYEMQKTQADVVRSQVNLSEAQLRQSEAELKELRIRFDQTLIYAPIHGQVALRYVDVGALMGPTTPLVRVVNLRTMVTAANVPERDVGKLRVGNAAQVRVDAFGSQVFSGRVARIAPVLDAATRSGSIEIEIPNPGSLLKAEMFARVELDLATTRDATLIPREALVYRGTQPGVYLVKESRPEFRAIETGLTEEGKVEVLANLEPGTEIVGQGSTMIGEGDQIRFLGRGNRGQGPEAAPANRADSAGASPSSASRRDVHDVARAPGAGVPPAAAAAQ